MSFLHLTSLALLTLSHLTASAPSPFPSSLEPRVCGTILPPSNYYQIYEDPQLVNETAGLGPFSPSGDFSFATSQSANNVNERDLVASFKHVPCGTSSGPYQIEFNFVPDPRYTSSGSNTRIDVFAINGALPFVTETDGSITETPTWISTNAQTGSLIGTFSLPPVGTSTGSVVVINSVVCTPTVNLRFSITNDSPAAGSVDYFHGKAAGLRIRYGC